jgi:hypothetical protein
MLSHQSDDVGLAEVAERVGYASASTWHRNEVDWGVKAAGNAPPLRLPLPANNLCAIY